ncbi:PAS domain-containing sensor histidine kinase [Methylosinus sp. Sm6]|uniref:PAS domain-containing sensor histidine kinase n=1 Tax=Methylosinus sp. Sm6 TaxID=2866948 RepID=UPI001C991871|nr:PAS domain-containing sensor histidine kinase [Methylosinus sp. Sm6]MBY6241606.1 PAS domain-containing sensor histidine kinase [Methylosinus sp. Sm6]
MPKLSVTWPAASRDWIERLAQSGRALAEAERARRVAFLAPRLALAAAVLLAAPLWVVAAGAPSSGESLLFALAQLPLLSVVALLRFDDLRVAQAVSAVGWPIFAGAAVLICGASTAAAGPLLAIGLVEATLAVDITLLGAATAAALALLTIAALARGESYALLLAAPLLAYAVALAAAAIRVTRFDAGEARRKTADIALLCESAGDLIIGFDEGGAVSRVIGERHRIYGLEARDLMGRGFFHRVHVADRPAFLKLVSDTIATDAPASAELRLRVGSTAGAGDYAEPVFHIFEARSRPTQGGARVICFVSDVTAARRAEEALAEARRESELASVGKTRFLANVSHELRTPLNAIIGFSDMLASEQLAPADPVKRREYAEIIHNSGQHLLAVVNSILDMSKIESGSMQIVPEPFSAPELVDQCVKMMQLKAEQAEVELVSDYAAGLQEIIGDKRACKQILINLLSNAVKFTPARGRVTVRLYPDGNRLAIAVSDSGVGIAASDLGRLGNPFFQASACHDRAFEGTGLGLSVVRGLVGLHGGAIAVESAPQRGTCVTVRLPLDCRPHQSRPPALARIETIARRSAIRQGDVDLHDDIEIRDDMMVKKIA